MERRPVLRLGLKLSQDAPIEAFQQVWKIADEAGFDHCWAFDHLAMREDGSARPLFEGWTLLAAMAQATRRTRVGLLVTGMIYRHPALLAKAAVTVDHVSGGRLEFGIGAGWAPAESRMYGFDIDHSVGRLSEGLEVMKQLWTEERTNFAGRHYHLQDAVAHPKPLQQPHPPIWIGADGPRMLALAARHADVWNPADGQFDAATAAGRRLLEACRAIGRDPAEIRWSTHLHFEGTDPVGLLQEVRRWHQAGFSEQVIYLSGSDPVAAAELAAAEILPRARQLV